MLTLKISTDNAAFEDNGIANETAECLRRLANKIESYGDDAFLNVIVERWTILDSNGNKVGEAETIKGH